MTYWTVLWITMLGGPFDGERTGILYSSEAACLAAHTLVGSTLNYDHQIACVETDRASGSIRPKRRPE